MSAHIWTDGERTGGIPWACVQEGLGVGAGKCAASASRWGPAVCTGSSSGQQAGATLRALPLRVFSPSFSGLPPGIPSLRSQGE